MKKAIVLSLTKMGEKTICTTVLTDFNTDHPRQCRLHMPPNDHLAINYMALGSNVMNEYWHPGRLVGVDLWKVDGRHKRQTHPEDIIVMPPPAVYDEVFSVRDLAQLVSPFTYNSVEELFPDIEHYGGSWFVRPGKELPISIGYVVCQNIIFISGPQLKNYRVELTDMSGKTYNVSLKDEELMAKLRRNQLLKNLAGENLLARCALSRPWKKPGSDELLCYMMVSWTSQG